MKVVNIMNIVRRIDELEEHSTKRLLAFTAEQLLARGDVVFQKMGDTGVWFRQQYKGMSEAELARAVGSSPQAFNQRMKTGKFSTEK